MCLSIEVCTATSKCPAPEGSNSKYSLPIVLVAEKSKIKVLVDLMSGDGHLPGL